MDESSLPLKVIKVKYNDSMCRISNGAVISIASLEDRVRSSFKLSPSDDISFMYTDSDGDIINLASNPDIVDALQYQQLNPLRVELKVVTKDKVGTRTRSTEPPLPLSSSSSPAPSSSDDFRGLSATFQHPAAAGSATDKALKGSPFEAVQDLCTSMEKQLQEALGVDGMMERQLRAELGANGTMEKQLRAALGADGTIMTDLRDALREEGLIVKYLREALGVDGPIKKHLREALGLNGPIKKHLREALGVDGTLVKYLRLALGVDDTIEEHLREVLEAQKALEGQFY